MYRTRDAARATAAKLAAEAADQDRQHGKAYEGASAPEETFDYVRQRARQYLDDSSARREARDALIRRQHEVELQKCAYRTAQDGPLGPACLAFYKYLAPREEHLIRRISGDGQPERVVEVVGEHEPHLNLLCPDTIVYNDGEAPFWLYTSRDGHVYRTDTFTDRHVTKKLGDEEDIFVAALLKRPHWEHPSSSNDTTLLDTRELRILAATPPQGLHAVQKFIKCHGPRAWIARAVYAGRLAPFAWIITNKAGFHEPGSDTRHRFTTATDVPGAVTVFRAAGHAVADLCAQNAKLSSFLEHRLQVQFDELVADYIRDERGRWWLIQVKAYTLRKPPPSRPLSATAAVARQAAAGAGLNDSSATRASSGTALTGSSRAAGRGASPLLPTPHSEIVRLRRCRCCGIGFPQQELSFALTQRMVRDMAAHLQRRGVVLRWFSRAETMSHEAQSGGAGSVATGAGALAVCRGCYDLYLAEKQVESLSAQLARMVGIPPARQERAIRMQEERMPDNWQLDLPLGEAVLVARNNSALVPTRLRQYRAVVILHELVGVPKMAARPTNFSLEFDWFGQRTEIPLALASPVTTVCKMRTFYFFAAPDDTGLRPFLLRTGQITVRLVLRATSPSSSPSPVPTAGAAGATAAAAASATAVAFGSRPASAASAARSATERSGSTRRLTGRWTPTSPGAASHCAGAGAGAGGASAPSAAPAAPMAPVTVGSAALSLRPFHSDGVTVVDLRPLFSGVDLQACSLHAAVGIERGPEVDTPRLQTSMTEWEGVWVPEPSFYTTDPFPDEWMKALPDRRAGLGGERLLFGAGSPPRSQRTSPARAAARSAGDESDAAGSGGDGDGDSTFFITATPLSPRADSAAPTASAAAVTPSAAGTGSPSRRPRSAAVPRSPSPVRALEREPHVTWLVVVQLHALHSTPAGLQGDRVTVQYSLLGHTHVSEAKPVRDASRPLVFDSTTVHRLDCAPAVLARRIMVESPLVLRLRSANRDEVGLTRIDLSPLASLGAQEGAFEFTVSAFGLRPRAGEPSTWMSVSVFLRPAAGEQWSPSRAPSPPTRPLSAPLSGSAPPPGRAQQR